MYFSFKTIPEDFLVNEILDFDLDWVWDYLYILFEKKQLNTMEIINLICKNFNIKRNNLWIAWLKDKDWITQQWISISKKHLKQCWWQDKFLSYLNTFTKTIRIWWHSLPLSVWKNKWNHFTIRLRKRKTLPDNLKILLEENIRNLSLSWFPNIFWYQRFWKWNKNFKKVLKIFSWEEKIRDNSYEQKFKFQTFWSLWFNEYVMRRWDSKDNILNWDIMVNWWNAFWTDIAIFIDNKLFHFDYWKEKENIEWTPVREPSNNLWESDYNSSKWIPTWPVLWIEQLLCKQTTPWRKYDEDILKESKFLEWWYKILKQFKIYWYRRPLWILPQDLQWERENWDLILNFFLPTWCYASTYLTFLLKDIDPAWCESNNLKILRIKQEL